MLYSTIIMGLKKYFSNAFHPEELVSRQISSRWAGIYARLAKTSIFQGASSTTLKQRHIIILSSQEREELANYNMNKIIQENSQNFRKISL